MRKTNSTSTWNNLGPFVWTRTVHRADCNFLSASQRFCGQVGVNRGAQIAAQITTNIVRWSLLIAYKLFQHPAWRWRNFRQRMSHHHFYDLIKKKTRIKGVWGVCKKGFYIEIILLFDHFAHNKLGNQSLGKFANCFSKVRLHATSLRTFTYTVHCTLYTVHHCRL